MLRVFIGYDSNEPIAYHVLCQSIISRSTRPVCLIPIALNCMSSVFEREANELQSTEFSFSRFLVPYLSNYEGWSLFVDCDMINLRDISELFDQANEKYSIMVVKHEYEVKEQTKFLGKTQSKYAMKNWSSVMLFNNSKCRSLTPDYVNTASGLELHQFKWLESHSEIGEIETKWNYLVGVYPPMNDVGLVHFTEGGPYFPEYRNVDYADVWRDEHTRHSIPLPT